MITIDPTEGAYDDVVKPGDDWPEFVFLTRDSSDEDGRLSQVVEVWSEPPAMSRAEHDDGSPAPGSCWLPRDPERDGILGRYALKSAEKFFRTVPATDAECVRAPCR